MSAAPVAWAPTIYAEHAEPAPPALPLLGEHQADVAVVGAGITGLATALHLAEGGARVVVLDRGGIGWGASGRNGGQVNPGLKPDPDEVAARGGERLVQAAWDAPLLVYELIERHGIACELARGGTLRAAVTAADMPGLERLAAQCARRGMDVALLDPAEIAATTGTKAYRAALHDRRGGQFNPLAYTRGLARAAAAFGARLHGQSAALRLDAEGNRWRLTGEGFSLDAAQVVLAANGYTDGLWPGLARTVVPVFSAMLASEALPASARAAILARREVLYELGSVTTYYRVDAAGRLLIGGRSRSRSMAGREAFGFLGRHATALWPALGGVRWSHGWNGQLAMSVDHYPHWHEPAPGVFACLAYNGRGNATATLLGRELALRVGGRERSELLLAPTPIRPIPLHRFWKLAVAARVAWGTRKAR